MFNNEEMEMKTRTVKTLLFTAAMLVAAGQAVIAEAHDLNDFLGASASAVDYVQVTCGIGTHHLLVAIDDVATVDGIQMSVLVHKGIVAASATAPDGGTSPSITLAGSPGNGVYDVFVSKTKAGSENYHLLYHCQNADGTVHTATTLAYKQDQ
jgi:hypothetical protein